jgi:hypothetical protein
VEAEEKEGKVRRLEAYHIKGDYFEVTKALIDCSVTIIQEFDFENDPQPKL